MKGPGSGERRGVVAGMDGEEITMDSTETATLREVCDGVTLAVTASANAMHIALDLHAAHHFSRRGSSG